MEIGVAFYIGAFGVRWYSLLIISAVLVGIPLAIIEARRRKEDPDHVFSLVTIALPLGIIGARLYHVIHYWDEIYAHNPWLILGGEGLGIFGAIIGGILGLIIFCQWKKVSILRWGDIAAPSLLLGQAIGRWGNFFDQSLYGHPTDLPWAIYIDLARRLPGVEAYEYFHPLFLYESLWNALGVFLLLFLGRKLIRHLMDGDILFGYLIWYSFGRFFLEKLRIEYWVIAGIPTAQWISALAIVVSLAAMTYGRYRLRHTP